MTRNNDSHGTPTQIKTHV